MWYIYEYVKPSAKYFIHRKKSNSVQLPITLIFQICWFLRYFIQPESMHVVVNFKDNLLLWRLKCQNLQQSPQANEDSNRTQVIHWTMFMGMVLCIRLAIIAWQHQWLIGTPKRQLQMSCTWNNWNLTTSMLWKHKIAYRNILILEFAKFQITPKYPLFPAVCGSNKEKNN